MRTVAFALGLVGVLVLLAYELRMAPPAPAPSRPAETATDALGLPPRRAPPTVAGAPPSGVAPLAMPATVEDAEKMSPAFRAFMAPAHANHPEVVANWDLELGFLDYLRQCVAGRVHSRGMIRQTYEWKVGADGTSELTAIIYDESLSDSDGVPGKVPIPLTPDEMQLVQSCSDHWARLGMRREDRPLHVTARRFPLEEDPLYEIIHDGHF